MRLCQLAISRGNPGKVWRFAINVLCFIRVSAACGCSSLIMRERERERESESECVLARVQVWVLLPSLLQAVGWVITMQGTLQRASIFLRRQ